MKQSSCPRSKLVTLIVLSLLVAALVGCSQPAAPSAPAPTAAPKAAAPEAQKAAPAKQAQPEAKEAKPAKEAVKEVRKPPVKMTVAYSALTGAMAPLWVAKEKGLFEKYGLDIDLRFIQGTGTIVQALVAGEITMARAGGDAIVNARVGGSDLIMVAGGTDVIVLSLYSRPEIQQVSDLRGKTVVIGNLGGTPNVAGRYALQKHGLDPEKDVSLLQTGGPPERLAALQSGQVQAAVIGPPATLQARKSGLRELVDITALAIPYIQMPVSVRQQYLANNRETVLNFLKAYVEGIALTKKEKAFAMKVIGEYTKTEDKDILDETYEAFVPKVLPRVPYVPLEGLKAVLSEAAAANPKVQDANPAIFYDNGLMKELDESGFIKKLYGE
ncbi:MAG: ABC transporter substrate-binding protein [Chloroflexi bacterium]|nr:ABC transporter substrate-binding protein [Chloroflexota bacterium]